MAKVEKMVKKETMAKGLASVERELCDLWRRLVCQTLPNYISTPILASLSDRTEKKSNPPNRRKIWNKIRRTSYVKCVCKYVCQETFREGFLFPSLRTRVFPTGYSQTSIIHMLVGILFILFFFFFAKFVASMDTQRTSAFCHGAPSPFLLFFVLFCVRVIILDLWKLFFR